MTGTAQGYAGVATALAGATTQFYGAARTGAAAKGIVEASRDEAIGLLTTADATARAALNRSHAALQDIAFLNDVTDAGRRFLNRRGTESVGLVNAEAAASGVELTGSPLLAAVDAAYAVESRIAGLELSRRVGTRRFRFEAEREAQRAADVREAAARQAKGLVGVGASAAARLRAQQVRTVLGGVTSLANEGLINTASGLMPKPTTPFAGQDVGGDL